MENQRHQQRKAARRAKKAAIREAINECRAKQFVRRTFASYSSLRPRKPDPGAGGWYAEVPYTGQEYDPEKFWVYEGGWDHEHCHACNLRINPGDEYWQTVEEFPLELCLLCYERLHDNPA